MPCGDGNTHTHTSTHAFTHTPAPPASPLATAAVLQEAAVPLADQILSVTFPLINGHLLPPFSLHGYTLSLCSSNHLIVMTFNPSELVWRGARLRFLGGFFSARLPTLLPGYLAATETSWGRDTRARKQTNQWGSVRLEDRHNTSVFSSGYYCCQTCARIRSFSRKKKKGSLHFYLTMVGLYFWEPLSYNNIMSRSDRRVESFSKPDMLPNTPKKKNTQKNLFLNPIFAQEILFPSCSKEKTCTHLVLVRRTWLHCYCNDFLIPRRGVT